MSSHQEFTEVEASIIILHNSMLKRQQNIKKTNNNKKPKNAVVIIFSPRTSSKAEKIMLATLAPWSGILGSKLVIIVST